MKGGAKEFVKQVLQRLGLFGLTFRLHESLKARRENRLVGPAPDGLAVPPSKLIVLVEGDADAGVFLRDGAAIAETIAAMLAARGAPIEHAIHPRFRLRLRARPAAFPTVARARRLAWKRLQPHPRRLVPRPPSVRTIQCEPAGAAARLSG